MSRWAGDDVRVERGRGAAGDGRHRARRASIADDLPEPDEEKRRELREAAIKQVIAGDAKVRAARGQQGGQARQDARAAGRAGRGPVRRARAREDGQDLRRAGRVRRRAAAELPGPGHQPGHPGSGDLQRPAAQQDPGARPHARTTRRSGSRTTTATHYRAAVLRHGADDESLKTYYERQSSGRYSVDGQVTDWVKVRYNEARYGRSNGYPCPSNVCSNTLVPDPGRAQPVGRPTRRPRGKTDAQIKAEPRVLRPVGPQRLRPRRQLQRAGRVHRPLPDRPRRRRPGRRRPVSGRGRDLVAPLEGVQELDGTAGPDGNKDGGAQIGNTGLWVADYTMQPENGGVSVFAHEYAHDLGLPDEYDTAAATARGNAVNWWTLMAQSRAVRRRGAGHRHPRGRPRRVGQAAARLARLRGRRPRAQTRTLDLGPHEYNSAKAQGVVVPLPQKPVTTQLGAPRGGHQAVVVGHRATSVRPR